MCGLAGIITARGAEAPSRERLERAVGALHHRGPDATGFYVTSEAALGSTRLSIIDLAGGDQPVTNEDGTVVTVYNGEIWNHAELRGELERAGHAFRTRADTEVIVHGYEEWGDELPARLAGMFAFVVWDSRRQRALLARDRVGKKPLFYAETPGGLVFGSDMRSVLVVGDLAPELDKERVPEFLFQRYVGAPRTLLQGIRKLLPGHTLTYDGHRLDERAYWRLSPGAPESLDPHELRELLRDAVEQRLMSDVPLGVLLSGGVDSSAVLGLMREAGAESIASFTIGFGDRAFDERPRARLAAESFGTEHHEVAVDTREFFDAIPRLAWYRDEPIAEPSEIPLLLLAEFAGRHVKVVLTGDGGDELFGGYPKYRAERLLRLGGPPAAAALRLAGRLLATRPSHRRLDRAVATLAVHDTLLRWASWFRTFSAAELQQFLRPELHEASSPERLTQPLRDHLDGYEGLDAGRKMLVGDFLTYLPDNMLLRADKVLMAASLEGRMPLLDHRVVESVSNAPDSQRAGLRAAKQGLRRAVGDLVPQEILHDPKRGFPVPVARFLVDEPSRLLERVLLSDRTLDRGIYEPDELRALVRDERSYLPDRELKLFTSAALELWLRTNVDRVLLRPPESAVELLEEPTAAPLQTA